LDLFLDIIPLAVVPRRAGRTRRTGRRQQVLV